MNESEHEKIPPKRSKTKELTEQEMIEQLAESVLYVLKKDMQKDHEPFEAYACHLKVRFHRKSKLFKQRVVQGYEALLEALHGMPHQ